MTEPRPEAKHAAAWWASRLGRADHDNGDALQSAYITAATAKINQTFTDEQREAFRSELESGIETHLQQWDWRPDQPRFGSAMRCISVDYGPCSILADAAERAGLKRLSMFDLPVKTTMWIDPGHVAVSEGYCAPVAVIWQPDQPS